MWSSLCAVVLTLAPGQGDGLSQALIERAYDEVAPAIGLVSYTAENTQLSTGKITKRKNDALGLVVAPDGLVLTHGHILLENSQPMNIRVTVGQGEDEHVYDATLLKKPDDVNVCFLRLESEEPLDLPYVKFTPGATLALGEPVVLFGILAAPLDFTPSAATGRIGAVLDKPRTIYCLGSSVRFGFVTGPVVNAQGQVVGVVGFDLSPSEGGELYVRSGHPLVYQAGLFAQYLAEPPSETAIAQDRDDAWLGVFTQPLTDDLAEYWGLEQDGGVVISTVVAGSPADQAGFRSGDVITEFDGLAVRPRLDREIAQFTKLVRETGVEKEVDVAFVRDGRPMHAAVDLAARPTPSREAAEHTDDLFGLTVRELTTDVRILLNLPDVVQGVIVRRVRGGSSAQLAGMRPGIIIMDFGGYPVTNLADFRDAFAKVAAAKPEEVTAFCRAGSATGFFRLEPRWE